MFDRVLTRFQPVLEEFLNSSPMRALRGGEMTVADYRAILRQIFHHTRENPQLQALATVYFRGRQRDVARAFYRHSFSEIGDDQLALNDFVTLSGDASGVPYENPLPATTALLSYGFYQIYNLNPVGYLGYLFFLEFTPTRAGGALLEALTNAGVPRNAMTFLKDHTTVDVGHNKLMETYVDRLVRSEAELDCIVYAMKTTGYLYAEMLAHAMADARSPAVRGWNWEELNADGVLPGDFTRAVA